MKKYLLVMGIMVFMLVFAAGILCAQEAEQDEPVVPSEETADTSEEYTNFTTGQRVGAWALNYFVLPGLGSYVFMQDIKGGTIQVVMGVAGRGLAITGVVLFYSAIMSPESYDSSDGSADLMDAFFTYVFFMVAGGILATANTIYGIVRVATYDKPRPKTASLVDPSAWSVAILPGANGVEKVSLAYTLRY